jgi:hypothetical protein
MACCSANVICAVPQVLGKEVWSHLFRFLLIARPNSQELSFNAAAAKMAHISFLWRS